MAAWMRHRLYIRYEALSVGTVEADADGVLVFSYEASWLMMAAAFPLSIALKLKEGLYRGKAVEAFFENLLPEGSQRRQLEVLAGLPEGDDIAFLKRFGEDCAGALTISVNPEATTPIDANRRPAVSVSFDDIERAIVEGLPIQSILDDDGELPPFSLAGAQAKFPCILRDGAIIMPRDGEPTTHIIKLPIRAGEKLLDSVQNEFLCMRLAAAAGLNIPNIKLIGEKIPLFVIERFDRLQNPSHTKRLHTQDFCQALGRLSREKYERHGGPSFADCYRLLADESSEIAHDQIAILEWLAYNLVVGNNDSHAKNLSFLLHEGGLRLAPSYDLVCTTIYKQYNDYFAFKIGETTSWQKIRPDSIEAFARTLQITPTFVRSRWLGVFDRVEAALANLPEAIGTDKTLMKTFRKVEKVVQMRLPELRKHVGQKKSTK